MNILVVGKSITGLSAFAQERPPHGPTFPRPDGAESGRGNGIPRPLSPIDQPFAEMRPEYELQLSAVLPS